MNLYEVLTNDKVLDKLSTLRGEQLTREEKIKRLEILSAKRKPDTTTSKTQIPF